MRTSMTYFLPRFFRTEPTYFFDCKHFPPHGTHPIGKHLLFFRMLLSTFLKTGVLPSRVFVRCVYYMFLSFSFCWFPFRFYQSSFSIQNLEHIKKILLKYDMFDKIYFNYIGSSNLNIYNLFGLKFITK